MSVEDKNMVFKAYIINDFFYESRGAFAAFFLNIGGK